VKLQNKNKGQSQREEILNNKWKEIPMIRKQVKES